MRRPCDRREIKTRSVGPWRWRWQAFRQSPDSIREHARPGAQDEDGDVLKDGFRSARLTTEQALAELLGEASKYGSRS